MRFPPTHTTASGRTVSGRTISRAADSSGETDTDGDYVGALVVVFRTAVQPGDNHRVAATLKQAAMDVLTETAPPPGPPQTQFQVPASDDEVALFIGDLSPLLTVWRKLHVEVDSMAAADATNTQTGTIPAPPVYIQQTGKGLIPLEELEEEFAATDQHRVGRIDIEGYADPFTTDQTDLDGTYHQVRILNAPADIANALGASYTLWDDDAGNDLNLQPPFHMVGFDKPPVNLPTPPDTWLMPIVYAGVYVLPVLADPDTYQPDSPFKFQVRTKQAARTTGNDNGQITSSAEFWAVHITSAFQGYIVKDHDPDSEDLGQYGITVETWLLGTTVSGSLIYMETIRDKTRGNAQSLQRLERYTVVHESGHQFVLQHEDGYWPPGDEENPADDFIMTDVTNPSGMAPNVRFSPISRSKIREIEHPPLEEGEEP